MKAESSLGLSRTLQRRHIQMIALGGVIGAGLFVGSGVVVKSAGPAAVLSFALTGAIVVLVMRMLGEMAAAFPAVGGFYEYNRLALGELAGFLTGWMYWYFWVIETNLHLGRNRLVAEKKNLVLDQQLAETVHSLLREVGRKVDPLDQGAEGASHACYLHIHF